MPKHVDGIIEDWKSYLEEKRRYFQHYYTLKISANQRIQEFILLRTIGTGTFGRVLLAILKQTQKEYAIKIVDKHTIVAENMVPHIVSEKKVLQSIRFPFVAHMEFFFHDNSYIYFVMPFIQGGEIFSLLNFVHRFTEEETLFYAAQLVLTLEFFHYIDLVYRDLKPENLLLDKRGYLKIVDFGFAKVLKNNERTYTICGTPEYVAPEILVAYGYGKSVDWWALGILIYEFCSGTTPFKANNEFEVYEGINNGIYNFPNFFTSELKDLIHMLLEQDVSKRLGCLRRGAADIKEHFWFKSVNWLDVINQNLEAPFVPDIISPVDDRFFAEYSNHQLIISSQNMYKDKFVDFG